MGSLISFVVFVVLPIFALGVLWKEAEGESERQRRNRKTRADFHREEDEGDWLNRQV